jgi:hypothetical protein
MVSVNISIYLTPDEYEKYYPNRRELNSVAREAVRAKLSEKTNTEGT